MENEKAGLPSYSAATGANPAWRGRSPMRRSRVFKILALGCLSFIAYAQWRQLTALPEDASARVNSSFLSIERLQEDLQVCAKLQSKPQDPIGAGRERNARYIDGHHPTLIKNATVWVGEPVPGTSAEDARLGKGYEWVTSDVYLEYGLVKKVAKDIDASSLPANSLVWNANGRPLTAGIIDMHSHAGVSPLPGLWGNEDDNEMSEDVTPYARSIDGLKPNDWQFQVIKSGGVTTSLVLPGSGNNIGGEAYVVKHAVGKPDGRNETSAVDMLADPDRNWRYMKMACGENAKRVYGKVGERGPVSRMGESYEFRRAFEQAAKIVQAQDDWCTKAEVVGVQNMETYLPQDLKWESLSAALRGQVHINTHCYTIPDLEAFVDHTNEFKFAIRAFHHAHMTYLVPEILKRAWGSSPPASALFADNMWYKDEAYIGSEYAGKILWENGLTPIYVSDNPVLNAQHVVYEAAKAHGYGLPYHVALASVTSAPAERLGLGLRLGKVKPGFDADITVWDSDPLSIGATPVQVWIDGTAQFENPIELKKPFSTPDAPVVASDSKPGEPDEPVMVEDVVFTGIAKNFLSKGSESTAEDEEHTVVISGGKITCIGKCAQQVLAASKAGSNVIHLENGYLTKPFVAFGSLLGLNTIDSEDDTDNGPTVGQFSRGVDGLTLDNKKLHYARRYGVTKAISAPKYNDAATHYGTSVGFSTGALTPIEEGAIFADDVAVHYTLGLGAKEEAKAMSAAFGALRRKLLTAATSKENITDAYSEEAYLAQVVKGTLPLSITVHSADAIATLLKIKAAVDKVISDASIKLVIIGGAESHLVAEELAAAKVGVVLSPLQSYRVSWDQRRALTGAPLTNGTAIDALVDAGVVAAIGLEEDWLCRNMGLLAGIAYKNGGGRLGESEALDLVGANVHKMLGLKGLQDDASDFVVFEGSPMEIGGKVRAVGGGARGVMVFE